MSFPVSLYPSQKKYIEDRFPRKVALMTRDYGKSWMETLGISIDCKEHEVRKTSAKWFLLTQVDQQTQRNIQYCTNHARVLGLATEVVPEEVLLYDGPNNTGKLRAYTQHTVRFEHGGAITALPTNPNSARGAHGNLSWDEPGHTPHNEELWAAVAPIASRKGRRVHFQGTGGPKRGPFFEAVNDSEAAVREGRTPPWSVHKVDVYQAIAEGVPIDLEHVKVISKGARFRNEYLVEFEDDGSRLIPWELILACEEHDTLEVPMLLVAEEQKDRWLPFLDRQSYRLSEGDQGYDSPQAWARLFAPLTTTKRDLYLGFDVARHRHLAVITIVEPDGIWRRVRAIIAFHDRRFGEMKGALWAAIECCRRACIDKGGLGEQLTEETVEHFGEYRAESVDFGGKGVKEDLATRVERAFEDRTPRIPVSQALRESIHSVYSVVTAAGKKRFDAESTELGGHADYFWAFALSLMATGDGALTIPRIETFGERTWSRERGMLE